MEGREEQWPLEKIVIGDRLRKEMGDLRSLRESIASRGQLQPVLITPDGALVSGARRVAAMRELRRPSIRAFVCTDLDSALERIWIEHDENVCRKDFTPSEAVAAAKMLRQLERKLAAERQAEARRRPRKIGSSETEEPTASKSNRETQARVAKAVGMGKTKLRKAEAVVDAAASGVPGAAEAVKQMDSTGNVEAAFRAVGKPVSGKRQGWLVKKNEDRLADRIGRLEGWCRSLEMINLSAALSGLSDECIEDYRRALNECVRAIRAFSGRLTKGDTK